MMLVICFLAASPIIAVAVVQWIIDPVASTFNTLYGRPKPAASALPFNVNGHPVSQPDMPRLKVRP